MGLDQIYRGKLVPRNIAGVIETEVAWLWEEDGIIMSVSRDADRTRRKISFAIKVMEKLARGKKIYLLADMTKARNYDREDRENFRKEADRLFAAVALICDSPFSTMLANIMFVAHKTPYPVKKFTEVSKAKEWIREKMKKKNESVESLPFSDQG